MSKDILLRYAEIKIEIAKLEEEAEMLRPEALLFVQEIRGDTDQPVALKELPGYTFSIQKRKKWDYPQAIKSAEDNLKTLKKNAEATGEATYTETESLVFNKPQE